MIVVAFHVIALVVSLFFGWLGSRLLRLEYDRWQDFAGLAAMGIAAGLFQVAVGWS